VAGYDVAVTLVVPLFEEYVHVRTPGVFPVGGSPVAMGPWVIILLKRLPNGEIGPIPGPLLPLIRNGLPIILELGQ
jgi:hypothetical protein